MASTVRSFCYTIIASLVLVMISLGFLQTNRSGTSNEVALRARSNVGLKMSISNLLHRAKKDNRTFFEQRLMIQNGLSKSLQSQQIKRHKDVQSVCSRLPQQRNINNAQTTNVESDQLEQDAYNPKHFRELLVNDDLRVIYCVVPKVACTNWKRVLLLLTGEMNVDRIEDIRSPDVHSHLDKKYLRRLDSYSSDEIKHRLQTYFKFMFAREPLERVLSAYQNKFANTQIFNEYFAYHYGRQIIKDYRVNASRESLLKGNDVTFEEFIQFLLAKRTAAEQEQVNPHWKPFDHLCRPCTVQYDYIGKYETLKEDAAAVLNIIGLNQQLLKFPASRSGRTSQLMAQKYSKISPKNVKQLLNLYRNDYLMYGYSNPKFEYGQSNAHAM